MKKYFTFLFMGFLLSSCAQKAVRSTSLPKAKWETKIQVKDLERKSVSAVYIDMVSVKNERLRMEVSAILGLPVATVVFNKKTFQAALYREKKYYEGSLDEQSLQKVLKVPLSASWIYAMAFDEPIQGNGWICQIPAAPAALQTDLPETCMNQKLNYRVDWSRKADGSKSVHIKTDKTEMNWFFQAPVTNFEDKAEAYDLKAPQGFQVNKI